MHVVDGFEVELVYWPWTPNICLVGVGDFGDRVVLVDVEDVPLDPESAVSSKLRPSYVHGQSHCERMRRQR